MKYNCHNLYFNDCQQNAKKKPRKIVNLHKIRKISRILYQNITKQKKCKHFSIKKCKFANLPYKAIFGIIAVRLGVMPYAVNLPLRKRGIQHEFNSVSRRVG